VTVLSTLARLGLDPWKETAELVALGRDAARSAVGNAACSISGWPKPAETAKTPAKANEPKAAGKEAPTKSKTS
jgi:hypothetical protein